MKRRVLNFLCAFLLLAGAGLLAYPGLAERVNAKSQSRASESYDSVVASMSAEEIASELERARDYNRRLLETENSLYEPSLVEGYDEALALPGGVMAYIVIDRLNLRLPVRHGTDEGTLASGAGHLEGSALPVGGEGRSVISAHCGVPGKRLFTDLDRLERGDVFSIFVLGQELEYTVSDIRTVLPGETEYLLPEPGRDLCTLLTCTPYGVNTHRLLVTGERTGE